MVPAYLREKALKAGLSAAAHFAVVMFGTSAHANTVIFTVDDGARSGSFAIDTHAQPGYYNPTWNVIMPIINPTGAFIGDTYAQFFSDKTGAGFTTISDNFHYDGGPQLYTGSEAAPIFLPGVYSGFTGGATGNPSLTIAPHAPAPTVGGGMLAALAALAGLALTRLRNRKALGMRV